jgi:hypothetical protein
MQSFIHLATHNQGQRPKTPMLRLDAVHEIKSPFSCTYDFKLLELP